MLISLAFVATLSASAMAAEAAQSLESKNGEFIFSKYPPRALAAGEQGAVSFRASTNAKGLVLDCEVIKSSGYWRLDRETCDLIVSHATFKPTLDGEGKARAAVHDGVVNWHIAGQAEIGFQHCADQARRG